MSLAGGVFVVAGGMVAADDATSFCNSLFLFLFDFCLLKGGPSDVAPPLRTSEEGPPEGRTALRADNCCLDVEGRGIGGTTEWATEEDSGIEVGSTGELRWREGAVLYAYVAAPRFSSIVSGDFLKFDKPTEAAATVEGPASFSTSESAGGVSNGSDEFVRSGPPEVPSSITGFPSFKGGEENHPTSELSTFSVCFLFLALLVSAPTNGYN